MRTRTKRRLTLPAEGGTATGGGAVHTGDVGHRVFFDDLPSFGGSARWPCQLRRHADWIKTRAPRPRALLGECVDDAIRGIAQAQMAGYGRSRPFRAGSYGCQLVHAYWLERVFSENFVWKVLCRPVMLGVNRCVRQTSEQA